jgi:iron-sulfur cluster assembly accessory protein
MTMPASQTTPLINLTPAAVQHVKRAMASEGLADHGLRIAVVTGGCSGNEYALSFAEQPLAGDAEFHFEGVRVFVDAAGAEKLGGTVLDYVHSLSGGGLRFKNPNATHQCGCGTSFSTE